ncbi:MAG: hypothetical protein K1X57_09075 [Gemmataceae bacterium]|nr:hypothetical protein [Gemmataceae bacterium]
MNRIKIVRRPVRGGMLLAIVVAMSLASGRANAQILSGQVDTFSGGSIANWTEGPGSPNPPVNVSTGGPLGAGDSFLQNISSGGGGPGSKQVMYNQSQWTGSYTAVNVNSLTAMMANFGAAPVSMRVAIQGGPGLTQFGSLTPVVLPADGIWRPVTFNLSPSGLSLIAGSDSLATVLGSVSELRILAAASGPSFNGDAIAANIGLDNLTATSVPEPASIVLVGVTGFSVVLGRMRSRRRKV